MDTPRPHGTTSTRSKAGVLMSGLLLISFFLVAPSAEAQTESSTVAKNDPSTPSSRDASTIYVTGKRRSIEKTSGSAYIMDESELEQFEYDDVQRVLNRIPGVYIRDEDGFGLRPNIGIRGVSSDRSAKVVLLEDGILLGPAPYAAPAAYFAPLTTRMVGLEVFKGPAAIRTGPFTVGGAINYLTAGIPEDHEGMVDLAVGQFGYFKGHARYGWGNDFVGFLLEGLRLSSSGFKELDGGGDTGFEKNEVMGKFRIGTDPAERIYHRLELKAGWADEVSNETYLGLTQADFDATPYRRYAASRLANMDWERTQIEVSYGLSVGADLEARVTAYRHDFTRAWFKFNRFGDGSPPQPILANDVQPEVGILRGEFPSFPNVDDPRSPNDPGVLRIGTNDRTYISQGIQLDGDAQLDHGGGFGQNIRFGARLHYDEVNRDHTEQTFEMVAFGENRGDLVRTAFPRETTLFNKDSALAFSAFVHDEIRLFDDLLISPGGRVEFISTRREQRTVANDPTSEDETLERTQFVFVPGVGVYYQVVPWLGVLAGVHQGFSPVGPGNPDTVDPEESTNYEAGLRFKSGMTNAEVIGFFSDYNNLLLTCTFSQGCPDSEVGKQFNTGTIWIYGLEASASHEIALPGEARIALDGRYTLSLSEFQDSFESGNPQFETVIEGDRLPYLPEHQANVTVRGSVPIGPVLTSLSLSYTFVDRMRDFASSEGVGELRRGIEVTESNFTDVQHVVDLTLQGYISGVHRVYLRIDNLFDQAYVASRRPFGARPGRPFSAQIGYSQRFGE